MRRWLKTTIRRLLRRSRASVWYHPAYRLPAASIEAATGIDPRRACSAAQYLLDHGLIIRRDLHTPTPIRYQDLARVHSDALLRSLHEAAQLADIFAVDAADVHVDELLHTIRLACGGTLEAARASLRSKHPALNLLGGFHHAGPNRAGGLCAANDVAVAVAALREDGYHGRVVVLDLDAHPPDGTAECFAGDCSVWIGSLSACDWGPLEGIDETVLPRRCDDLTYLAALDALLLRMPRADLAFVVAGGDVVEGDRAGGMALTPGGAQQRDLRALGALEGISSVWLPGGGYSPQAWRVLAGTGAVLSVGTPQPVSTEHDPLRHRFVSVAVTLTRPALAGDLELTTEDVMADLGHAPHAQARFLDFYTTEGLEYALERYGILGHLRRLGYDAFRVTIDHDGPAHRMRLLARAAGSEHLLIECSVERQVVADKRALFVRWLTLQDPHGRFDGRRAALPGQEVPGLGLGQEAAQLLLRAATRLGLDGIAFRPAWFHTAHAAARARMCFIDPARQGRYEALTRDLAELPLLEATRAIAKHRVVMNGEPYVWEADVMVSWIGSPDQAAVARARERVRFSLIAATPP